MQINIQQILMWVTKQKANLSKYGRPLGRIGLFFGLSYFLAQATSAWIASVMLGDITSTYTIRGTVTRMAGGDAVPRPNINYVSMRRNILDRNLFNSEGEVPDESEVNLEDQEQTSSSFDLNAACHKTTLPIKLIGTIYLGGQSSIATIRENGLEVADTYREGDAIIDHEAAVVVKIDRNQVIVNNSGRKECLELKVSTGGDDRADEFPEVVDNGAPPPPEETAPPSADSGSSSCSLEEKFVREQLGEGFGKIIQSARMVPNTSDGKMNGFKIFAIQPGTLFSQAGFKNGDIITQVNDVSLKEPDQGWALYQAFQDDTEIRINVLRNGKNPININCGIK